MTKGNLIIGAGGHGKVIADMMLVQGMPLMGYLDDDPIHLGQQVLGLPVVGRVEQWRDFDPGGLVIGIGDNVVRRDIMQGLSPEANSLWITVVHPRATVAGSARLGTGTVVVAGAVINPKVVIGQHTIINTGATVDHDCVIGDFVHIAPGANLAGDVHVEEGAFLGIGCCVIPGCKIGAWAVVGAGAVVVRDVPPGVTAKGVPARWSA